MSVQNKNKNKRLSMLSLLPVFAKGRFCLRLSLSCNLIKINKETDKNAGSILSVYIVTLTMISSPLSML